jgi:hypothetical protein
MANLCSAQVTWNLFGKNLQGIKGQNFFICIHVLQWALVWVQIKALVWKPIIIR